MNDYDALCSTGSNDRRISLKDYQYKIKKLIYAAIYIRPNFYFIFKRLSQYLGDFAYYYKQALKILLRYIRFIIDLDIEYKSLESSESNFKIYLNFDYAANRLNKKSIFEYIYIFAEKSIA